MQNLMQSRLIYKNYFRFFQGPLNWNKSNNFFSCMHAIEVNSFESNLINLPVVIETVQVSQS